MTFNVNCKLSYRGHLAALRRWEHDGDGVGGEVLQLARVVDLQGEESMIERTKRVIGARHSSEKER